VRPLHGCKAIAQRRIANGELRQEMTPLVHELAPRDFDATNASRPADLPRGKRIAATRGVGVNATKILGNRAKRRILG